MRSNRYIFLITFGSLIALFLGCNLGGNSNVEEAYIRLDLGQDTSTVASITGPVMANGLGTEAPLPIQDYNIIVSATDMKTINLNYPGSTEIIEFSVPAGSNRNIELIANVDPADSSIYLSFSGITVTDLEAGETKEVNIQMGPVDTKLLIPDLYNNRLVMVNDMSGIEWKEISQVEIEAVIYDIMPYEVDFDSMGRIYISGNNRIIRINEIDDMATTIAEEIFNVTSATEIPIAVDRLNDYLYYFNPVYNELWSVQLSDDTTMPMLAVDPVKGMSVDKAGYVYLYSNDGATYGLTKIDPNTNNILIENTIDIGYYIEDVIIIDDYLYASDWDNKSIVKFDLDLNIISLAFGSIAEPWDDDTNFDVGEFFGPRRFMAVLNKRITLIDEGYLDDSSSDANLDRLIQFENMDGDGWQIYGQVNGNGEGNFEFYNYY